MEYNKVEYELDNTTREKMRQKKQGSLNPNYGKPRDEATKQKIAKSQSERWAKIGAFNEAAKMSATKRVWEKVRFSGFTNFTLLQCHDVAAIYQGYDLNSKTSAGYRVYYHFNGSLQFEDFENIEDAESLYLSTLNPNLTILTNESALKVVVLGILP